MDIFERMNTKILYLGDTTLDTAASYLAGVMKHFKIDFDYRPSDQAFIDDLLAKDYAVMIISDYPGSNFTAEQLEAVAEKVKAGMGLLMLGGWESFTGANHEYTDTPLKDVLPVVMQPSDDRINSSGPCLIEKSVDHEIVAGLPFEKHTPGIGGFNRFQSKPGANTILWSRQFRAFLKEGDDFEFEPFAEAEPLLVVSNYGKGRTCAFATDAAPHWVGGLVDWGDARVESQAEGAEAIEVGNWYAQFFANMVKWTARQI
ncbi:putative membrane protein [Anaerohalosphaera lusitana]|uniref:Putative membrane protein n=2 Tax=Anaerohalosphaera lusitana TaxID=1936003 RepID=A0A1U9NMT4_9BACT|nr:putative membrane protein [Anaerohalosphaera lusitana]